MAESNLAAELRDVSVDYSSPSGTVHALQSVDIAVPVGSSTAIQGRSGSGKSTLLSVMALLRQPTAGKVVVAGKDLTRSSEGKLSRYRAEHVAVIFQSFHLEPALTVLDNVMVPHYFNGRSPMRKERSKALDILDTLGISDLARRKPSAMSGGQRQRVAIARALFSEPAIVLADEPTGNLDEDTAGIVTDLLFRVPEEFGAAVVVVTHDEVVAERASRRFTIEKGQVRQR